MKLKELKHLGSQEMLMAELIGKVGERIPLPKGPQPFYRKKQQLIEAGNMVSDFITSGDVILRKETAEHDGVLKTLNKVRIVGGETKVKDITRGFEETKGVVHQKNVRAYRLRINDKKILEKLSSVPFHRSEYCTSDFLDRTHEVIPVDTNTSELNWKRNARYEGYRNETLKLNNFQLSAKFDGRGRMGYEGASLEGFRPHGKCYESACFELTPRKLTEEGKTTINVLHHTPVTLKEASGKEELLSYIRLQQIGSANETGSTGMTVECDVTNSGLLIAGLSFKSPEMLLATNGYGEPTRADSHTVFGNAYGLDRATAKQIHTPLLHGASDKSIAKKLTEITGESFSKESVAASNEKAYGEAYRNINAIAQYGRQVMSNKRSEVSWSMPDGFRATHRAYTVHVPLELKLKNRNVKVMTSMPLLLDGNDHPVYDAKTPGARPATSTSRGTHTKIMGLYADIIHSIDSYVMRRVIDSDLELLAKHDAFLIHPNDVSKLKSILKEAYSDIYEMDLITKILKQIEHSTGVTMPELFMGDALNKIEDSNLFVTVE